MKKADVQCFPKTPIFFTRDMQKTVVSDGKALHDWSKDWEFTVWATGGLSGVDFPPLQREPTLITCYDGNVNSQFLSADSQQSGVGTADTHVTCLPAPARHRCLTNPSGLSSLSVLSPCNKDERIGFAEYGCSRKIPAHRRAWIPETHVTSVWLILKTIERKTEGFLLSQLSGLPTVLLSAGSFQRAGRWTQCPAWAQWENLPSDLGIGRPSHPTAEQTEAKVIESFANSHSAGMCVRQSGWAFNSLVGYVCNFK